MKSINFTKYGLTVALGCGTFASIYYLKNLFQKYFWYKKIRKFTQCPIKNVLLINSMAEWNDDCATFLRRGAEMGAVGLDGEWVTNRAQPNSTLSLLQIGLYTGECLLIRLCNMESIPISLKDFLEDRSIVKVGVFIEEDCRRLNESFNCMVASWVDLRYLAIKSYEAVGSFPDPNMGLKSLAERHLSLDIKDNETTVSNWNAQELSTTQIQYAASDANISVRLLLCFLCDIYAVVETNVGSVLVTVAENYMCLRYKDPKTSKKKKKGTKRRRTTAC